MKKEFVARTSLFSVLSIMMLMVVVNSVYPLEKGSNDLEVMFGNGVISVNLKDAPITRVLEAISERGKIQFSVDETLSGEKITTAFQKIPLEQALKRILRSLNYSLIYGQNNRLSNVIVFGKKGAFERPVGGLPISFGKAIEYAKNTKQESSPDNFEVIENAPPPDEGIQSTPVKDGDFKVIKNVPPPGGPVEMTEEEQEQFKVVKDAAPPGS